MPSTVNSTGHHWLRQPFPTPPAAGGRCPQNVRKSGCPPSSTKASNSSTVRASAAETVMAQCYQNGRGCASLFAVPHHEDVNRVLALGDKAVALVERPRPASLQDVQPERALTP